MQKRYFLIGKGNKRTIHVAHTLRQIVGILAVMRLGLVEYSEIDRAKAVAFFRLGFQVKNWG